MDAIQTRGDAEVAKPAGVREVAALAGVSRQTVSRVLNSSPDVAEATVKRVRAAMAELGYRVNNAARALGTNRTRTLGVVPVDALQYGPARTLAAIEASVRESGWWLSTAFADGADPDSVRAAISHLQASGVDALIVFAPHERIVEVAREFMTDQPTVMLLAAGHSGPYVDHVAGGRLAVAALAEAGHERIAHLAGPLDWLEAEARLAGYSAELDQRGLEFRSIHRGDWTGESGRRAAADVLASGATAVFAGNDQMALGLTTGFRELGLDVPAEFSVVGFDGTPDSGVYWPRLTTVKQDFDEVARRAVIMAMAGESDEVDVPVAPILVARDSIKPLKR